VGKLCRSAFDRVHASLLLTADRLAAARRGDGAAPADQQHTLRQRSCDARHDDRADRAFDYWIDRGTRWLRRGDRSEIREWDCVEYVRDAIALGERKGLILIAHERAEEAGMARCVEWLRTVSADVPVWFIPSGEPFSTLPARI
jgi:hypothetical protein